MPSSKVVAILAEDGRIFFIDTERNYSVVHELKESTKV